MLVGIKAHKEFQNLNGLANTCGEICLLSPAVTVQRTQKSRFVPESHLTQPARAQLSELGLKLCLVTQKEKMTGCGSEAQMCGSKPVMEKPEAVVVTEPVGLAPMETETEASEVKDHVQVEESGRLTSQLLRDNPDSVEKQAVPDQIDGHKDKKSHNVVVVLALPAAGVKVKDLLKSGGNHNAKFKDVEDKSVAETVTKLDEIKHDNGLSGSSSAEIKVKPQDDDNGVWGTEEEQAAFVKEVEAFHKNNNLEFRRPKFYKQNLNLLKLWRAVNKLGGYEKSYMVYLLLFLFVAHRTCTSVSSTFRNYYEKALLKYEMHGHEPPKSAPSTAEPITAVPITAIPSTAEPITAVPITAIPSTAEPITAVPITAIPSTAEPITAVPQQPGSTQAPGSSGVKRAAAARAMKDKSSSPAPKSVRQPKTSGSLKRKTPPSVVYDGVQLSLHNAKRLQFGTKAVDIGDASEWVTINVDKNDNGYCIYVLIPGNMHEEVNVKCDPEGRLVISGEPKKVNDPWGIKPFKKVLKLPSRIDSSKTHVVVSKTGRLKVIAPFEQADVME
ncbi:hypothetical protein V6N12_060488 [Hibiscus sabdariffa]|uniref:SHSP domain-containing protein n=1 Tax=Hibiscus sabdariffa TaxID=183260 RepID=A0ABR2D4K2_9ROSI